MRHTPISRQRSDWERVEQSDLIIDATRAAMWQRAVSDGWLRVLVADEPIIGWHLSISFVDHRNRPTRYPRWDEIVHAREQLLPPDLGFVMHLPPLSEYVALHDTTFHLHQHPEP